MKNCLKTMKNLAVLFVVLLVCFYSVQGCCAKTPSLRFAQISDAHYALDQEDTSYKLLKSSPCLLDDAIQQVNNTSNIDFTIFTGDLINLPKEKDLMSFIAHANLLNTPWYPVLGNHDTSPTESLTKQKFFDIICCHNKDFCYKNKYYSFTPKKGYKVIVLDTIFDDKRCSNGAISDEQLSWLKDELSVSKGDIVLIFTHVPVVEPYPSENHRLLNSYDLKLLLKKFDNPIIVCSGHYHATKIVQEDNVLYIETPSLVTYPCAFRIIDITPQKKKVMVDVYLKETRLKELQSKAKSKCFGANMLYGQEKDRTYTYEIEK